METSHYLIPLPVVLSIAGDVVISPPSQLYPVRPVVYPGHGVSCKSHISLHSRTAREGNVFSQDQTYSLCHQNICQDYNYNYISPHTWEGHCRRPTQPLFSSCLSQLWQCDIQRVESNQVEICTFPRPGWANYGHSQPSQSDWLYLTRHLIALSAFFNTFNESCRVTYNIIIVIK